MKFYSGNYPGSFSGYFSNIPTGWNKWDAMECESDDEELGMETMPFIEDIEFEEIITVVNPNDGSMNCQNTI